VQHSDKCGMHWQTHSIGINHVECIVIMWTSRPSSPRVRKKNGNMMNHYVKIEYCHISGYWVILIWLAIFFLSPVATQGHMQRHGWIATYKERGLVWRGSWAINIGLDACEVFFLPMQRTGMFPSLSQACIWKNYRCKLGLKYHVDNIHVQNGSYNILCKAYMFTRRKTR